MESTMNGAGETEKPAPEPEEHPRGAGCEHEMSSSAPSAAAAEGSSTPGSSTQGEEPREEPAGLPRLNYNLLEHKWKLSIVTFLLVLESSLLPIALFYGLWFGTTLRHGIRKSPPRLFSAPLFFLYLYLVSLCRKGHTIANL